ncbi:MAG: MFS transporter [Chloroflexi bacterium]|nr:MFS transporter [Chloroflexota bacterium]
MSRLSQLNASVLQRTVGSMRQTWARDRVLIALMGQVFLTMLGISIVGPVMPLYASSFGVSAAMVGSLVTAFGLARIVMNIPAGGLCERLGRKPLLVAGPLITSLAALLTGLAGEFNQLILWRFVQGLGSSLQTTTAMTVLADISTRETRGRSMSLYQGSLLLGSSFGPTLGGFVAQAWGYRAVFFVYSVLALLAAIWAFNAVRETKGCSPADTSPTDRSVSTTEVQTSPNTRNSVLALLSDLGFLLVSAVTLTVFFTRSGGRSTVLPLFGSQRLGLTPGQLGFTFTFISIWNLITLNWSGTLSDKLGRKAVIVPGCLLSGFSLLVFSLSGNYALFLIGAALMGLGTGLAGPAPAAYVADLSKAGRHGLTMGMYRTFGDIGVSVGPILLGWLSDQLGYAFALRTNGLMFIITGLAFGLFARETVKRSMGTQPSEARHDRRT